MNVEIYNMATSKGAEGIFLARSDTANKKISVGDKGERSEYYCAFIRDRYYISLTGSDTKKHTQSILLKTAKIIDKKIQSSLKESK
jgi:hypothetical protein